MTSFNQAMNRAKKHATNLKSLQASHISGTSLITSAIATTPASPQISADLHRLQSEIRALKAAVKTPGNQSAPPSYTSAISSAPTPKRPHSSNSKPFKRTKAVQPTTTATSRPPTQASPRPREPATVTARVPNRTCTSPVCRSTNRNHRTEDCRALKEFLKQQKAGAFDGINVDG